MLFNGILTLSDKFNAKNLLPHEKGPTFKAKIIHLQDKGILTCFWFQ